MARYGRSAYGVGSRYGLDLYSEYSVEPVRATTTVDRVFAVATTVNIVSAVAFPAARRITITTSDDHGFVPGTQIRLQGITTDPWASFNGLHEVITVVSSDVFTIEADWYYDSATTVTFGGTPPTALAQLDSAIGIDHRFTDPWGRPIYDRVQVSWLEPNQVTKMRLLRSNTGLPSSATDPFSAVLQEWNMPVSSGISTVVHDDDPPNRRRFAYLDTKVIPGREYYYGVFVYTAANGWTPAGSAIVTTNSDHNSLQAFTSALPAYLTNQYVGPGVGVAVMSEPDRTQKLTEFLSGFAWVYDGLLTKIDMLRDVWDPTRAPLALLDHAVETLGVKSEPALGARTGRALLTNVAAITQERATMRAIELLVESVTGLSATCAVGRNMLASTDESSFEGVTVDTEVALSAAGVPVDKPSFSNVIAGTGRWYIDNATIKKVLGDLSNTGTYIARHRNSDDTWTPNDRFGLRLDVVTSSKDISMRLGDRIRISSITPNTTTLADVTTAWPHGLEAGDTVSVSLDGGTTTWSAPVISSVWERGLRIDITSAPSTLTNATKGLAISYTDAYFFGPTVRLIQGIPVTPNGIYSLVGKFIAPSRSLSLKVEYWDRFGNSISDPNASSTATGTVNDGTSTNTWTTLSNGATAPSTAFVATISITLTTNNTATQWFKVDSLMLAAGGTPYNESTSNYESTLPYDGNFDYTYEDARLVTVTIDRAQRYSGGAVAVPADLEAVIRSRLIDVLAENLPIGTAYKITFIN